MSRKALKGQLRDRVPVFGPDDRVIELADPARVRCLARAKNADVVTRRDGQVVRINLRCLSDDTNLVKHRGNPRRYSHDHETDANPPRVWTIRYIPSDVQDIFRASVLDNLKEAA